MIKGIYGKYGVFSQIPDEAAKSEIITDYSREVPLVDDVYIDFSQSAPGKTGDNTDLALEGNGFFAIRTEAGARYATASETIKYVADVLQSVSTE